MDSWGYPEPDDIIIQAAVEVQDVVDIDKGVRTLGDIWPQIVMGTHIDFGNPYLKVNPALFTPPDLNRFLAIRCRAVSAMEKYGCNVNGDAFPAEELKKSYHTLIGKGFYIEHASNDPRNAIGIVAHAQWLDEPQYVVAVALVDKIKYPKAAEMIRNKLQNGRAGVSIGCIAAEAQCSICGNVAKKRYEICQCMDRRNPFCKKGKKQPDGNIAFDICKGITHYELSYTGLPADRDALPQMVLGAVQTTAAKEEEGQAPVTKGITVPSEQELTQMVTKEVDSTVKSFYHKIIKGEMDKQLADDMRNIQRQIRPIIRQLVSQYVTASKEVVEVR